MNIPEEEYGTDVISSPRVTNILRPEAALIVNVEEDELALAETTRLDRTIEA